MADRPKYPIPWIATYLLTALALIAGSFFAVWYVERQSSPFDYTDPDVQFLERIVLSRDPREGDFTGLNGGDWRALCLAGWGGDLETALEAADIPPESGRAIREAHAAISEAVEKTEFVLIYTDGTGTAKAVHHPHGFAFAREGAAKCATPDDPAVRLPVRRE